MAKGISKLAGEPDHKGPSKVLFFVYLFVCFLYAHNGIRTHDPEIKNHTLY